MSLPSARVGHAPESLDRMRRGLLGMVVVSLAACASRAPAEGMPGGWDDAPFARGMASWYGGERRGRRTASGEPFDPRALTAAHRSLPFGTRVRVRSVRTGREVVVRINDRGPRAADRIIDLSQGAAQALGIAALGVSEVLLWRE